MVTIKIEAVGFSSKAKCDINVEVKATNLTRDDIAEKLGTLLYSVEEMGFDYVTSEVYELAIITARKAVLSQRYSTIYDKDGLIVSMRDA